MSSPGKSRHHAIFSFSSLFEIITQGMFLGSLALTAYLIGGSTMCFAVLSLSQLVHSFNLRSHHSLLETGLFGNKKLVLSFLSLCHPGNAWWWHWHHCSPSSIPSPFPVFSGRSCGFCPCFLWFWWNCRNTLTKI